MEAWDSVHGRAQYYVQSAHSLNPALQKELPPVGSVVAYETASQRRPGDTLPGYVAINVTQSQAGLIKSGFLPATYSPFHIDPATGLGAYSMEEDSRKDFLRRWELLQKFDARMRNDSGLAAKAYRDYHNYYEGAVSLMADRRAARVFKIESADRERYGKNVTGDACILARNLVEADAGTRFIFLQQDGWDHHKDIYDRKNHYQHSWELDSALGSLIEDLAVRKRADGRTLLEETMVVCMGEFGRTPGGLTAGLNGRDHYQYAFTVLFAGGGVKGGRQGDRIGLGGEALDLYGRPRHDDLFGARHRLEEDPKRHSVRPRFLLHRAVRCEGDDRQPGDLHSLRLTDPNRATTQSNGVVRALKPPRRADRLLARAAQKPSHDREGVSVGPLRPIHGKNKSRAGRFAESVTWGATFDGVVGLRLTHAGLRSFACRAELALPRCESTRRLPRRPYSPPDERVRLRIGKPLRGRIPL
jgi:hypothetical protein